MASHNAWKAEFKQRMGILATIIIAISFIVSGVLVGAFSTQGTSPTSNSLEGVPAAAPIVFPAPLLVISAVLAGILIGFFVIYRIPPDIISSLTFSLETLGWVITTSHPGRGSCVARKGTWEVSIAISLYNFAQGQWGSVNLLLSNLNFSQWEENCKQFQDAGFSVSKEPPPCVVTCQTNVPKLPWQILRITSLLGVRKDTTAFS